MSVNTKYTDKPNDQYQRANLKGLVGYFHKRWQPYSMTLHNYEIFIDTDSSICDKVKRSDSFTL